MWVPYSGTSLQRTRDLVLAPDPNQPSADCFQNSLCGSNPGLVWDWDLVVLKEGSVWGGGGGEDIPPTILIQSLPSTLRFYKLDLYTRL